MIVVFKILGVILAWFAFDDVVRLGLSMYLGLDPDFSVPIVFMASLSISIKFAVAILLLCFTESVLGFLKIDEGLRIEGNEIAISMGVASAVAIYFFVQGMATSISTYTVARLQLSSLNNPDGVNLLATNTFRWPWHDFVYGIVQAGLGIALLVTVFAYNHFMKFRVLDR